jgi:hypothetical protein
MRTQAFAASAFMAALLGAGTAGAANAKASLKAEESTSEASAEASAKGDSEETDDRTDERLRPTSGFQHSLRLGVSMPAGQTADGRSLKDDVTRRVPIMLDIGYRASPLWYFAILGVAGVDRSADHCRVASGAATGECTLEGWRLAAEVLLHPFDRRSFDPWFGLAFGWEALQQKALIPPDPAAGAAAGFGTTIRSTTQGPALDIQAGVDFPIEGKLAAGPFLGYTGGIYVDRTVQCPAGASDIGITCVSPDIDSVGLHHWLTIGVRGRFGP